MTIEEFILIKIKDMAELYSKKLTQNTIALYIEDLKDFTKEQIVDALAAHRRDEIRGRFFPYPADVIAQINKKISSLDASYEEEAEKEWQEIMRSIKMFGRYGLVVYDNNITNEIVNLKMGGYISLCNMLSSDISKNRDFFINKYIQKRKKIDLQNSMDNIIKCHIKNVVSVLNLDENKLPGTLLGI